VTDQDRQANGSLVLVVKAPDGGRIHLDFVRSESPVPHYRVLGPYQVAYQGEGVRLVYVDRLLEVLEPILRTQPGNP